eukprot:15482786-Alexandrium_andersonii.AAC.1
MVASSVAVTLALMPAWFARWGQCASEERFAQVGETGLTLRQRLEEVLVIRERNWRDDVSLPPCRRA